MTTLAIYTDEYAAIQAAVQRAEGELTPEMEQALSLAHGNLSNKVQAYHHVMLEKRALIAAAEKDKKRLEKFIRLEKAKVARMQLMVEHAARTMGKQKEGAYVLKVGTLRLRATPSKQVVIHDLGLIPAEFLRYPKPEPRKDLIKAKLATGAAVPGASLETNYNPSIR